MKIEIDQIGSLPFQSSLLYGASRAGKTSLSATYPRPALLCSRRERGYVTVANMDPKLWYDPKVAPQIYAVDDIASLMGHLIKDIFPQVQTGKILTIVLELTFYADDAMRAMDVDEKNGWARYAGIEQHVHTVDTLIKKAVGTRVVYNTLALPEDAAKGTSGVLIPGKALAKKLPALCDVAGYMQQEDCGDHIDHVLHLATFGNFFAGHRYGSRLPRLVRNACFRDLEDLLSGKAKVDEDGTVVREVNKVVGLPPLQKK